MARKIKKDAKTNLCALADGRHRETNEVVLSPLFFSFLQPRPLSPVENY